MTTCCRRVLAIALLLALAGQVSAHEYWLQPGRFVLNQGEKTAVHLFVGGGLVKDREERPFQASKTSRFDVLTADRTENLLAALIDNTTPVYAFSRTDEGTYLLAMDRNWSFIKLEPAKFDDYLREDGMEYIIAERRKLGESKKEGRERYSRYLKCLVQVGKTRTQTYDRRTGQRLEIVPLQNPYLAKPNTRLGFRIEFDGKPLAGNTVFAANAGSLTQRRTTDANGEVWFKPARKGLWLIRLVVMRRCTEPDCAEADWQSFWAALTFGL